MENKQVMKKTFGIMTAITMVVGTVIGSGIFFKPQAIYTATGGKPGLGMIAWLITGLVSIAAALTFAEIAILIPKTGGMVEYLSEVFGEKVGYLAGWMQVVLALPAMAAGLAVIFADQVTLLTGNNVTIPVAIFVLIFVVILNCMSSKVGGGVQVVFTICKLVPLVLIIVFGFIKGSGTNTVFNPMVGEGLSTITVLGTLMVAILFAFEGWTNVGAIAGEMKNPGRDLPIAIVGGVSVITAIYFIINLAYLWVIPADQLAATSAPATLVARHIFGDFGSILITIGIMISCFGTCNGFLMSGSRVTYAMAEGGKLPFFKFLSKLNKIQAPANSIIFTGALSCIFALTGQYNLLTDLGVFSSWIFYTLTFVAVIVYRKQRPDIKRSYKVPLYPIIPILAIISGIFVVLNQFITATMLSLGSVIITLIGLPVYIYMNKKHMSNS